MMVIIPQPMMVIIPQPMMVIIPPTYDDDVHHQSHWKPYFMSEGKINFAQEKRSVDAICMQLFSGNKVLTISAIKVACTQQTSYSTV